MTENLNKPRRQRAILSCNDCRRRKLKCDRLSPCNRCMKGGIADTCAYGSEAHDSLSVGLEDAPAKKRVKRRASEGRDPSESASDVVEGDARRQPDQAAQERLEQLERDISVLQQHASIQVPEPKDQIEFLTRSPDLKGVSGPSPVMGMLKGRSYGTHFYGASSATSVIAHFPDLRSFMKLAYEDSVARRLSQDMKASEDRARLLRPHHRVLHVPTLRSLLPDRRTADILLQKYFETFETTLRIVHKPTFEAAYKAYWDVDSAADFEMDAMILAILACTSCTSTHTSPRYNHSGSTFHSKAVVWIRALEAWLKRQSNKRRSLVTLQVRSLRLLALATTSLKVKEYYQEVHAHVAIMRSAGMHRDPSIFGTRCTLFEGEMRRRLWATTMELELQASIDRGTSSVLSSLDWDCAPPRNIEDDELNIDQLELPRSHGITTYTDTAYLHVAKQTIGLRIAICSKVNSLKEKSDQQDIVEFEDKLQVHIEKIPRWTDPRSSQAKQLLELQLRQCIVIIHAPRALQVESRKLSHCRYAMITSLEAARATIDLHSSLIRAGNFSVLLTRQDYFRAILLITHIAYYAHRDNDLIMARMAKQIFDECHEKSLRLQEERAMRPGRGTEYFWYVSAAISLVGIQFQPAQSDLLKRQAVDRIAKLLYKVLSLQDDPTEETLANEIMLAYQRKPAVSTEVALHTSTDPPPVESFASAGLQLDAFGFGDSSEFLMDDLWFLNVPSFEENGPFSPGL